MKKRRLFVAITLAVLFSLILTITASACYSTASFTMDCAAVHFVGTVAEGEQVRLYVRLHSGPNWTDPRVQDDIILITTPGTFDVTVPWVENPDGKLHRVAITASIDGINWTQLALDEGWLSCPPPPEAEACSPGFWKNHTGAWVVYSPSDDFDTTFGVDLFNPNITLLDALKAKGGGVNKLARLGTGALLNATALNYPFTPAQVIAAVQAGDVTLLESVIENCPID